MNCPICGKNMLIVKDTRHSNPNVDGEHMIMRCRKCQNCEHTLYTKEVIVEYRGEFKVKWCNADRSNKRRNHNKQ